MTSKLYLLSLCLLALSVHAQQGPPDSNVSSNVPESVRAMIEESQGGRYTRMARMQVDMQYGDFLNGLQGDSRKRQQVEAAIVDVISERAETSEQAVSGNVSPSELETVSSYAYLRSQVAPLLNAEELQQLDAQQGAMAEQQLRNNYARELDQMAPDVTEANRELVLDTLVRHMLFKDSDAGQRARVSAEEMVNQQLMSLRQAREEIQPRMAGEQLQQVDLFLDQLRSNLFLNQSMSESLPQ